MCVLDLKSSLEKKGWGGGGRTGRRRTKCDRQTSSLILSLSLSLVISLSLSLSLSLSRSPLPVFVHMRGLEGDSAPSDT